uniref:3-isopropylmalate dehydratase large subunit n=1 Tax=Anunuuluaehu liula TaxID=3049639 RepID=UPI003003750E
MEFAGTVIDNINIKDRYNMVVEAGAQNGIIVLNNNTLEYVNQRSKIKYFEVIIPDKLAKYVTIFKYNLINIQPPIAKLKLIPKTMLTILPMLKMKKLIEHI